MVGGVAVIPTEAILKPVEPSPVVPAWAAVAAVSPRRMRVSPTGKEDRRRGPRNPIRVRRANSSCVIKPGPLLSWRQRDHRDRPRGYLSRLRMRPFQELPNLSRARARARAASISRFRGPASVTSESNRFRAAAVISLTARSNAASLARDGFAKPESFLTNWSEASRISSSVAGGSKLNSVLMFRHMALSPGLEEESEMWQPYLITSEWHRSDEGTFSKFVILTLDANEPFGDRSDTGCDVCARTDPCLRPPSFPCLSTTTWLRPSTGYAMLSALQSGCESGTIARNSSLGMGQSSWQRVPAGLRSTRRSPRKAVGRTQARRTTPSWCVCRMSIATSIGPRSAARRSCTLQQTNR